MLSANGRDLSRSFHGEGLQEALSEMRGKYALQLWQSNAEGETYETSTSEKNKEPVKLKDTRDQKKKRKKSVTLLLF